MENFRPRSNTVPTRLPSQRPKLLNKRPPSGHHGDQERPDSRRKAQAFEVTVPLEELETLRIQTPTEVEENSTDTETDTEEDVDEDTEEMLTAGERGGGKGKHGAKKDGQADGETLQPPPPAMVDEGRFFTVFAEGPSVYNIKDEDPTLDPSKRNASDNENNGVPKKATHSERFCYYGDGASNHNDGFRPRAFSESLGLLNPQKKPGAKGAKQEDMSLEPIMDILRREGFISTSAKAAVSRHFRSRAHRKYIKNTEEEVLPEQTREESVKTPDFMEPAKATESDPNHAQAQPVNFRPHAGKPSHSSLVEAGLVSGVGPVGAAPPPGAPEETSLDYLDANTANRLLNCDEKLPALRTGTDQPHLPSILKSPRRASSVESGGGGESDSGSRPPSPGDPAPSARAASPPPVPVISVSFHDPDRRQQQKRRLHINPVASVYEYNVGRYLQEDSDSDDSVTSLVASVVPDGVTATTPKGPLPRGSDALDAAMSHFRPQLVESEDEYTEEIEESAPEQGDSGAAPSRGDSPPPPPPPLARAEDVASARHVIKAFGRSRLRERATQFRAVGIGAAWAKGVIKADGAD